MSTLTIKAINEDKILLSLSADSSEDLKRTVNFFWLSEYNHLLLDNIEISLTEFSNKKNWLRTFWREQGHEVIFDNLDELKKLLSSLESTKNKFLEISQNPNHGQNVQLNFNNLKRELTNFQAANLKNLISMPNGANFSVPGAGKTMMTLLVWEYFKKNNFSEQLLVICPQSAFEAWEDEPRLVFNHEVNTHEYGNEAIPSKTELIYCNYEKLQSTKHLTRLKNWLKKKPSMLVIDEAHRIKSGHKSIRWRACAELAQLVKRVDLLTGTPMPQGEEDLVNLFTLSWKNLPKKFLTNHYLKNLQRGGVFVRTTKDELNLPKVTYKFVPLEMHELQAELYRALKKSYLGRFGLSSNDAKYFAQRGKAVMTLIAAASNPSLLNSSENEEAFLGLSWPPKELTSDKDLLKLMDRYLKYEMPVKFEWISKFVESKFKEKKKVLIWSSFVGNILALEKLLKSYNPAVIYGSVSGDDRKLELKKFRESDSCNVLITNAQTLGEGVSLHQVCHEAVYLDRNYNAGLYLQSLDRIHRLGLAQDQETNIYILQSKESIDLRINHRLDTKINKMGKFLNDPSLVEMTFVDQDEIDLNNYLGLDEADLNDLYKHLMDQDDSV
jgi:superfamily II DNA or RNA helicase